jgi:hypothetical protein
MLNLVLNLIQYWFSISLWPLGEILKQVQDDKFKNFQIFFLRFYCNTTSFLLSYQSRITVVSPGLLSQETKAICFK